MSKRFVIEGTWSGYRSGQDCLAHRQVYPASYKKLRAWADKTYSIRFTDGTFLYLSVRDCKPREHVKERKGYTGLINDCYYHNVISVEALPK